MMPYLFSKSLAAPIGDNTQAILSWFLLLVLAGPFDLLTEANDCTKILWSRRSFHYNHRHRRRPEEV